MMLGYMMFLQPFPIVSSLSSSSTQSSKECTAQGNGQEETTKGHPSAEVYQSAHGRRLSGFSRIHTIDGGEACTGGEQPCLHGPASRTMAQPSERQPP